jgi:Uma2 family endonuclease
MAALDATLVLPKVTGRSHSEINVAELKAMVEELDAITQQLPDSDGRPMESRRHVIQGGLLFETIEHAWAEREDFAAGFNQFMFYDKTQALAVIREVNAELRAGEPPPPGERAFRGPDFYVVRNIDGSYVRERWVTWEERGRLPDLIVELLSGSTRDKDLGEKKDLYERLRIPEYFVWYPFDPNQFQGWRLIRGEYVPLEPNERGWLWSDTLQFWLGPWEGRYKRDYTVWLRCYDENGNLILTGEEAAQAEAQAAQAEAEAAQAEAEAERQRAETAEAENARLRARLVELGIDPSA